MKSMTSYFSLLNTTLIPCDTLISKALVGIVRERKSEMYNNQWHIDHEKSI